MTSMARWSIYGALVNFGNEKELDRVLEDPEASEEAQGLFSAGMLSSKDAGGSAPFGSAVYFPMDDKLKYKVRITQSALVVRLFGQADDEAARKNRSRS